MDEEYEVEAIVGRRKDKKGKIEYLLSWVGYTERTWTPIAQCDCADKIADFEAAHPQTAPSTPAAPSSAARSSRRSGKRDTTPANTGRSFRSAARKQSASTSRSRKEDTPESAVPVADEPATLASVLSPIVSPAKTPQAAKKTTRNGNTDEPIDVSSGEESDGGIEIVDTPSKGKDRGRAKAAKSGAGAARTGSSSSERPTTSTAKPTRHASAVTSPVKNKVTDILEMTDSDEDERGERKNVAVLQPSSGPSSSTKATNGSPVEKKPTARSPSKSESEGEKSDEEGEKRKTSGRGRPTKSNTTSPVKKKARSPSQSESEGEKSEEDQGDRATMLARGRGARRRSPANKMSRSPRKSDSEDGESEADKDEEKKTAGRGRPARKNPRKIESSSEGEESEADEEQRTIITERGRGRTTRGNQCSKKKTSPSESESEESESEENSEDKKIKKVEAGERKRTRSMGSPPEEEEEDKETEEEEEEGEEDGERESRPRMIGRHPLAAGPPPKKKTPWGTRTRDSSEESAFLGDMGGRMRRKWKRKAKEATRHSTIKRARVNLAEPDIVTSESEQSEDGSEEEQETKRTERSARAGRVVLAPAAQSEHNDDDSITVASPRRNQNKSHVIDVSDDDEVEEVEVHDVDEESDDDEEVTPQPAKRKNHGILSVDDFLSELIIEQSYVVPIKFPVKDGDEPEPAGPESDYEPTARPATILSPHEMPRIGVWTRESYEEKYPIPSGFRREEGRDKERACHRDVIRVVAYCSDPVHPFVFAHLAMKENEEGVPIQEAVQAFHCMLASTLFPKAYSAFVLKMVTTVLKPESADEAGPGTGRSNPAPVKKPATTKKTASNLEASANHAMERAKRTGKRGG